MLSKSLPRDVLVGELSGSGTEFFSVAIDRRRGFRGHPLAGIRYTSRTHRAVKIKFYRRLKGVVLIGIQCTLQDCRWDYWRGLYILRELSISVEPLG